MGYVHYHPIYLDLKGRTVLIVGGGFVAMEKLASLMPTGAVITVVAPWATDEIKAWSASGELTWIQREFEASDIEPAFMVIAATNDPAVNTHVFRLGNERLRLSNSVDDPINCNFIMAALVRQGPMQVAVSSAGCSPALAQKVRNRIAGEILSAEMGELAEFLGDRRPRVKAVLPTYKVRQAFWEHVIDSPLPAVLSRHGTEAADEVFESLLNAAVRGAA